MDDSPKKRRISRNVGGWISSQFASKVDREWISNPKISSTNFFDPSFYVPQIGDTVLYYIAGHRQFLETYPDVLGTKLKNRTRIPLWERPKCKYTDFDKSRKREKKPIEKLTNNEQKDMDVSTNLDQGEEDQPTNHDQQRKDKKSMEYSSVQQSPWWDDEWLQGVQVGQHGCYPILCRVEKTHAEFPPDPFLKAEKDKHKSSNLPDIPKTKTSKDQILDTLRLAVTLRPLSPVLPPQWKEDGSVESTVLSIPPVFSFVTFPSKLDPFLIPFSWAYQISHSLSVNQQIALKGSDDEEFRIEEFVHLDSKFGTFRLDDKSTQIQKVISRVKSAPSKSDLLKKEISHHLHDMLETETEIILDIFASRQNEFPNGSPQTAGGDVLLYDLIRSSLPLWKGVAVTKSGSDQTIYFVSPWDIFTPGSLPTSPWIIGEHSFCLDESLRSKVEVAIEEFVKGNEASEMFLHPVKKKEAPLYYCAVPCSMCISHIQLRLKPNTKSAPPHRSYYRGIDAILNDVHTLFDNCILYNDAGSKIVKYADEVVSELRSNITKIVHDHNREIREARKKENEKRKLALKQSEDILRATETSAKHEIASSFIMNTVDNPFGYNLNREWLEQVSQECPDSWLPQAGDQVFYSSLLHGQFIQGHCRSLEPSQCRIVHTLPGSQCDIELRVNDQAEGSSPEDLSLHSGKIIWTRGCFPKAVCDDAHTFISRSPLLTIGLQLYDAKDVVVIHWRPCVFKSDSPPENELCPSCGLSRYCSFLRPCVGLTNALPKNDMTDETIRAVSRCFNLLKQRCNDGLTPAAKDKKATRSSLSNGYRIPEVDIRTEALPSYEHILTKKVVSNEVDAGVSRRGNEKRGDKKSDLPSFLKKTGFIPLWISDNGAVDGKCHGLSESLLPNTKLSLEFIRIRLDNRFYRSKKALELDIIEAYVATVFLMLCESARRKKSPIDIKKVAKQMLRQNAAESKEHDSLDDQAEVLSEEREHLRRLRVVRELYAAAIVSVSHTSYSELMFGIGSIPPNIMEDENALAQKLCKEETRAKIEKIIAALGKDPKANRFKTRPTTQQRINLRVVCNDRPYRLMQDTVVPIRTHATALVHGKTLTVKILVDGKAYTKKLDAGNDWSKAANRVSQIAKLRCDKGADLTPATLSNEVSSNHSTNVDRRVSQIVVNPTNQITGHISASVVNGFALPINNIYAQRSAMASNSFVILQNQMKAHSAISASITTLQSSGNAGQNCHPATNHLTVHQSAPFLQTFVPPLRQPQAHQSTPCVEGIFPHFNNRQIYQPSELGQSTARPLNSGRAGPRTKSSQIATAATDKSTTHRPGKLVQNVIQFYAMDCEENDALARLLFRRPNRSFPCARCQVKGVSFLECRVNFHHSNPDYDWFSSLGGAGGVDGLLHALSTGKEIKTATNGNSEIREAVQSKPNTLKENIAIAEPVEEIREADQSIPNTLKENIAIAEPVEEEQKDIVVDETIEDPTYWFEMAKTALITSEKIYADARKYAEAPVRVSKKFIETCFPVDKDDGHYEYCIICGLIGNLLCCDGCPNVVHSACIDLYDVPEDDWFCEECMRNKKNLRVGTEQDVATKQDNALVSDDARNSCALLSEQEVDLPFGRVDFDDTRISTVTMLIKELREKRWVQTELNTSKMNKPEEAESAPKPQQASCSEITAEVEGHSQALLGTGETTSQYTSEVISPTVHDSTVSDIERGNEISDANEPVNLIKRKRGRPRKSLPVEMTSSQNHHPDVLGQSMERVRMIKNSCKDTMNSFVNIDSLNAVDSVNIVASHETPKISLKQTKKRKEVASQDSEVLSVDSATGVFPTEFKVRKYSHPARLFDIQSVSFENCPSVQHQRSGKSIRRRRRTSG